MYPLLQKYNVDLSKYRASSYAHMEKVLRYCEDNNLKLVDNPFKKSKSGNSLVSYTCSCGNIATSMVNGFFEKTVYACKGCNASLINKIFKPIDSQKIIETIESKSFKVIHHTHTTRKNGSSWTLMCPKGHEFIRSGNHITDLKSNSCPTCWNPSLEEAWVRTLIEIHFNAPFPNTRPAWLLSEKTNRVLELDMYNEKLQLAFEYHGPQHFKAIFGQVRLDVSIRNDAERRRLCKLHGVSLIELRGPEKASNIHQFYRSLQQDLKFNGIDISEKSILQACAQVENLSVTGSAQMSQKINALLVKNNMSWVSGPYVNIESMITVSSNCCGQERERSVRSVLNLQYTERQHCPSCSKHKQTQARERHTNIAKLMCSFEGLTFKELHMNKYGQCSGFLFVDHTGKEGLVGIKRYKKFIAAYNLWRNPKEKCDTSVLDCESSQISPSQGP